MRNRQNITPALLAFLDESFSTKLTGTFTRKDSTSFPYEYDVLPIADTAYGITLRSLSVKQVAADECDWSGSIELGLIRIKNDDGTPVTENATTEGGHVTVYGPQLGYGYSEAGYQPEAAKINQSSNSGTVEDVEMFIQMLRVAVRIARIWTDDTWDALQKIADEVNADRRRRREEAAIETARVEAVLTEIMQTVGSRQVRVTIDGKKTPLVGELARKNATGLVLTVPWKKEPVEFHFSNVVKLEVKEANSGRFQEVTL